MHLLTFSHFDSLPVSVRPLQTFGCGGDGGERLGGGGEGGGGEGDGDGDGDGSPQQVFLQFRFCQFLSHFFLHFLWLLRSSFLHAFFAFVHGFLSLRSSQLFGSALETAARWRRVRATSSSEQPPPAALGRAAARPALRLATASETDSEQQQPPRLLGRAPS